MLIGTANVFLSLFAISTLVSQSAMDLFATLFTLTCLILLFTQPAYRANLFRRTGFESIALLWIAMTAISLILGQHLVAVPQWSKLADFRWFLLAVLVGRHLSFARVHLKTMSWHLVALAIGSAWAVFLFFWKSDPTTLQPMDMFPDGTVRTGGFHRQAIVFAQLYALWFMIPLGVLLFQAPTFNFYRKNQSQFWFNLSAISLTAAAVLLSFTRGVWLSIPIALFILMCFRNWKWALAMMVGGSAAVTSLALVWPMLQQRILQAFQGGDSERLHIWNANWRMFLDHPWFGVGYNHNVQLLPQYYQLNGAPNDLIVSHAHNQFLHILVGIGLAGFVFYLAFWVLALEKARRFAARQVSESPLRGIAYGIYGSILALLFGGLFESNFEHSKIRYTVALILGLLVWLEGQESNLSRADSERGTR